VSGGDIDAQRSTKRLIVDELESAIIRTEGLVRKDGK
jgi:hypothetical protein